MIEKVGHPQNTKVGISDFNPLKCKDGGFQPWKAKCLLVQTEMLSITCQWNGMP